MGQTGWARLQASFSRLEATPRIELGMEVLQTSALPLGYVAARSEPDSTLGLPPLRPAA